MFKRNFIIEQRKNNDWALLDSNQTVDQLGTQRDTGDTDAGTKRCAELVWSGLGVRMVRRKAEAWRQPPVELGAWDD